MSAPEKPAIVFVSLQVQSSWQSVPLGAASVAAALGADSRIAGKAAVRLLDWSLEDADLTGLSPEKAGALLAKKILDSVPSPFLIAFSVYVWSRPVFEFCARELARLSPASILAAGGPEATASPDTFTGFHHVIVGEGEAVFPELALALLSGAPVPKAVAEKRRAPTPDCANLPSPWLALTLDGCQAVSAHRGALWELARGCPYSCAYCYESLGEKKVRPIPLKRLESELAHFAKLGVERVFVLDPTYNANRERALSLLGMIEKKSKDIHFNFEVRAELLDRELVAAFSRIPCSLQIGLQSSNPEALKLVNRPSDLKGFSKKIGLLNDAGIVFGLDLMYGLPGDSLSTFRASLDYALSLYPNNLEIFRLAVLPGTALFAQKSALALDCEAKPPYHVRSTPKFPAADLDRAETLAAAADLFYTQGRAVTWFLSLLHALKLKPSQFLADFAEWLASQNPIRALAAEHKPHGEIEKLQIAFTEKKLAEKGKSYLAKAVCDIIALNGAWTRAFAEGEPSNLELSFHPEDLFSTDAMDLEYFAENACMEHCTARVFPTPDGPDLELT